VPTKRQRGIEMRVKQSVIDSIPFPEPSTDSDTEDDVTSALSELHIAHVLRIPKISLALVIGVIDHYSLPEINRIMFEDWKLFESELKTKVMLFVYVESLFEAV
jgi:hypothetical protein